MAVPVVLLRPQVLAGSNGPLLYEPREIAAAAHKWNGIPVTFGHPTTWDNIEVNADHPAAKHIGVLANCRWENNALRGTAVFDLKAVNAHSPDLLKSLKTGDQINVSTGLFTDKVPAPAGAAHNGIRYHSFARAHRPDHLAILPDTQAACSVADGCGLNLTNRQSRLWTITVKPDPVKPDPPKPKRRPKMSDEFLCNSLSFDRRRLAPNGDLFDLNENLLGPAPVRHDNHAVVNGLEMVAIESLAGFSKSRLAPGGEHLGTTYFATNSEYCEAAAKAGRKPKQNVMSSPFAGAESTVDFSSTQYLPVGDEDKMFGRGDRPGVPAERSDDDYLAGGKNRRKASAEDSDDDDEDEDEEEENLEDNSDDDDDDDDDSENNEGDNYAQGSMAGASGSAGLGQSGGKGVASEYGEARTPPGSSQKGGRSFMVHVPSNYPGFQEMPTEIHLHDFIQGLLKGRQG
jgi:hypothetical protein